MVLADTSHTKPSVIADFSDADLGAPTSPPRGGYQCGERLLSLPFFICKTSQDWPNFILRYQLCDGI